MKFKNIYVKCYGKNGTCIQFVQLFEYVSFPSLSHFLSLSLSLCICECACISAVQMPLLLNKLNQTTFIHSFDIFICFQTHFVQGERTTPTTGQLTTNTICRLLFKNFQQLLLFNCLSAISYLRVLFFPSLSLTLCTFN